jgi:serine/threonine protein kinase/tetratricopeptide (TPR) repeat protein
MPVSDWETIQSVDPSAIRLGSDFGPRYRIETLLGQGGMGRVYKAYDKELNRTVAIKVVRQGVMGEQDALSRFKQELVLASKISHKNILRIHDLGEVNGMKFISMAYVEGQDLHQIIRDNPRLPLERVLRFATQLAGALAAAHAEDIVHRDLKPQNILVDNNDQVYIADFGLAKSFAKGAVGMTQAGAYLGTPRYMSPEQVQGKPTDGRSDLYAYGLILYELVTGDVPFKGDSTMQVMYMRLQEKPKSPTLFNAELPGWLVRIIMRCLEPDPAHRYQNGYEILADLSSSQTSGFSRRGSSVQIPIPEFANQRWVWVTSGIVALLLVAMMIPAVRHLIPGFRVGKQNSHVSGIPTLGEGKYVAVLPFRILGDEQSLGYVAEGLNESLSAKLFQLKDLRLASDTAVAKVSYKEPLAQTARNLGVNLIVQGMIQGNADKMSIIIHLEDVADAKRLWTNTFEGGAKDLLTLEDKIYTELIAALAVKPTNDELAHGTDHPTENIEAYDLYLKGRKSMRGQQDPKNVQIAIDFFNQAVKVDPTFALAYTGLADASLLMYREKKDSFWSQKALGAAHQAERLNDKLPEVHFSLGNVYSATGESSQALTELKRAIDLSPNSDEGYRRLGTAYETTGRKDDAIKAYQRAIAINPYYWMNLNSLGVAYTNFGDYDKALQSFEQVIQLEPENAAGYDNKGALYFRQGKFNECIPAFQKALQLQPYAATYSNLGTAYFFLKRYPEAVQQFEKAVEMNPDDEMMMGNLADAYRWSSQKEKALATYEKAIGLAYKELQVNPRNAGVLANLALYYGKQGDTVKAAQFVKRARAIDEANVYYIYVNALIDTLSNRPADAVANLRSAFQKGYSVEDVKMDPEFAPLASRPDFQGLLKEFEAKRH